MKQTINQISLYQKMTSALAEAAKMEILNPKITYSSDGEEKEVILGDEFDGTVTINEFDTSWSPSEHNLEISKFFIFGKPSSLYGAGGITMPQNKIGIAVHMHSKTSNFQQTLGFGTIPNTDDQIEIEFRQTYPVGSLRGNLHLDFFLYLKEKNETNPKHASKVGMILSEDDIDNLVVVIDGEGSAFPISEFEDKNGPIWFLEKNWVEANIDTFNSSNVNLCLNVAHPLFEQIKNGKTAVSRALMGDIMVQAMSMIIQQVVIIEGHSLDDDSDALPDSVLSAVEYWVSTFEIDISSVFSISNSMRQHWDRQMFKGDKEND